MGQKRWVDDERKGGNRVYFCAGGEVMSETDVSAGHRFHRAPKRVLHPPESELRQQLSFSHNAVAT